MYYTAHANHLPLLTPYSAASRQSCMHGALWQMIYFTFNIKVRLGCVAVWLLTTAVRSVIYSAFLRRLCIDIWRLVATQVKKNDVSYSLEPDVKYARIEFVLYLDRKPLYYIVNIMMPCSFLVIISLLVRCIYLISVQS